MAPIAQEDDVDLQRESVVKGLCVYLNEDPENLVREYMATDIALIQETTVGIFAVKDNGSDKPQGIGIVLEGEMVLQGSDSIAFAGAMLFGLMYILDLNYPPDLRYTFEVLQKIIMELEGTTLSKKTQVLIQ